MVRPTDKRAEQALHGRALGAGDAPIEDQIAFYDEFWDAWHEKYRGLISPFYHFDEKSRMYMIRRALAEFAGKPDGREAFDLGCGRGRLASYLNDQGWKVGGIDLSHETIRYLSEEMPDIDFHAGDMFAYPNYRWNSYDLVTSSEVMEHIQPEQRGDFASLIHKLLAKDGILILTTPNQVVMERLDLRAEQPLDFWLKPEELRACFEKDFEILSLNTGAKCMKNRYLNRFWKLIPFVNGIADSRLFDTLEGKYQMLVARKRG